MSSEVSPASDTGEPKSKKRRIPGACDVCKKRKIRCDSGQMPGNRCTNCLTSGLECTHAEIMKTLGSAKGYVESLETRLEKMEKLLNKLLPGIDLTEQLDEEETVIQENAQSLPRNDADHLLGAIKKLTLNPEEHRFFGKSSGIQFVQTALNFKSHFAGPHHITNPALPKRRNEYWEPVPWLLPPSDDAEETQYTFPEPDLLATLVELYFDNVNCYHPTLHRPTFERKVKDKLYLQDHRFAGTLLMVCSLGARHSDDPRVFLEGESNFHTAGWKWHNQVRVIPKHLIYKPNLYELQTIALSSIFLMAISPVAWNQIGFGLRRAQDVGAHRRMRQSHPTPENEQWKRVFWVLLCLDWVAGTATGRPLAMHEQDYDQDLPVDCDDEFWDLPEPLNFRQPDHKPSDLAFFISYAKLLEIQASVTSIIYSPRKPRDLTGRAIPSSDAQNIMAFDSALNSWLLEIPDHLKWDPDRKNLLHFNQSALLYSGYYNVQIMVHRPYIPAPLEASRPGALPSLAICTNAARSCARIIHAQNKLGVEPNQNMLTAAFTAAIVLLLNSWSGKRSGFTYNPGKEMDDVQKCIHMLTMAEKRFLAAGRFNDILVRLISVGDIATDPLWARQYQEETDPPSAQNGYEPSIFALEPQPESDPAASKWPTELAQHYIEDFQASNDRVEESLRHPPRNDVAHGVDSPGNASVFSGFTKDNNSVFNGLSEVEQLMRMDPQQFSTDMIVDADVMSMWSAAPSGFQIADWESYIMSTGGPLQVPMYSGAYPASPSPGQPYQ
ncbi:putative fungal-specific transcription factor [Mycena galericulata]|nr:putative fungal-specific transcription factor [Mycena galericulata]